MFPLRRRRSWVHLARLGLAALALPAAMSTAKGNGTAALDLVAEVAIQLEASAVEKPDRQRLVDAGLAALKRERSCLSWRFVGETLSLACGGRALDVAWPPRSSRALGNVFRSALSVAHDDDNVPLKTADAMAGALADSLGDPFTAYLPVTEVAKLDTMVRQRIASPGIQLRPMQPQVIHDVRPGSDAERQGLSSGDRIVGIDEQPTDGKSFSDLSGVLIGQHGSVLRFDVITHTGEKRRVLVRRDVVPENSITSEELPGGFLYVRIPAFGSGVAREVAEELWDHQSRGVVIDLRQNPGGRIREGRELLELFFSEGHLGGYETRPGRPSQTYSAQADHNDVSLPVVMLVDGGSASASEYVSMVMKERGRATLLGTTSLGKGSMQNSYPMPGGGVLKVTFARYVGASEQALPGGGLTPHRFLPRPRSATALEGGSASRDAWVMAALDVLEGEGRYGGTAISRFGPTP